MAQGYLTILGEKPAVAKQLAKRRGGLVVILIQMLTEAPDDGHCGLPVNEPKNFSKCRRASIETARTL